MAKKLKTPKTDKVKTNRQPHNKHAAEQYMMVDADGNVVDADGMFTPDTRQAKLWTLKDTTGAVNVITPAHHQLLRRIFFSD